MRKQTTKFFAFLLSLLTLLSMGTFSNITVFAAENDNVQNSVKSQITDSWNAENDSDLATGDRTFEKTTDKDTVTVLKSPDEYYNYLSKNGGEFNKKLRATNAYPSSVDNSNSRFFPEVDTQGQIGSCTAWAQTYYQFTYTMNKQLGRTTTRSNTFSPKWTYNFAARGLKLRGSSSNEIYNIMQTQGTATWNTAPYDYNDWRTWSPYENVWKEASKYRLKSYQYITYGEGFTPITSANDIALNTMKAALNNGELLTYSTYVNSWNFKTIEGNPNVPENNNYKGEYIAVNMTGTEGSHRMTIVGYNDDIWVDINNNNIVEENEMGAFKIVNSWGKNYKNNGFSWVSYDALNEVSSVEGVELNAKRQAIFQWIARIDVEPYDSDSDIYLRYTLNSAARQETPLYVVAGKGDKYVEVAVTPYEIYESDNFSYDGTKNSNDGTMIFDLSRVIPNITSSQFKEYNWSVKFKDKNADSNTLTVKNVEIVDENSGDIYRPSESVPFTLNGREKTVRLFHNGENITIYYKGYDTPYIHYQVGNGSWTAVPGYAMDATNEVSGYTHKYKIELDAANATVCFNDGNDHWDNNNGANYIFEAGTYTFSNGKISKYDDDGFLKIKSFDITPANGIIKAGEYVSINVELENATGLAMCEYAYRDPNGQETIIHKYSTASGCSESFSTPGIYTLIVRAKSSPYDENTIYMEKTITVIDKDEPDDEVTIYYKGYSTPYIHYQIGDGEWTDAPGFEMTATNEINGYTHKYTIHLNNSAYANVCFNDGNGNWDSRYGANYKFEAGTYTYSNGKISRYFDDGSFKIKELKITPSDGKIKCGDSVKINLELKNATGSEVFRYSCINSNDQEYVIYDYSGATGCSNQFNAPGTYTLIVKAKAGYYATNEIYAKKTIIVS